MEEIINSAINSGVILGQRPEDYIAGGSPLTYEERNPSGNWEAYLPSEERQSSKNADSMACVSYSALNCIEIQLKFLTGVEPNFSDRALAKMSNTMPNGNYLWRVADTIRQEGLIDEALWPAPVDFTWDSYYEQIPVEIENTAGVFLTKYDVKYEWLPDMSKETLKYHLKQSPIQVVIPGHAITCFYSGASLDKYFDHYSPFIKTYGSPFQAAMKYVVTKKPDMTKITADNIDTLYQAVFHRDADTDGRSFWIGKQVEQFLVDVQGSEEFKKYDPLFRAAKSIEEWARQ